MIGFKIAGFLDFAGNGGRKLPRRMVGMIWRITRSKSAEIHGIMSK